MLDKLKSHLKTHGYSATSPRLAIFKYLQIHDRASIAALIASHRAQIDQASIYRTIALFKQLGIAQETIAGGHKLIELTDTFDSHHHHILCQNCGQTTTLEDPSLERRLHQLAATAGYTPLSHQIEVTGLCTTCTRKKEANATSA